MASAPTELPHAVTRAVEASLDIAESWLVWNGNPVPTADGDREYTPHKAIRRIGDHLIDHLAEIEAVLAGAPGGRIDRWHASSVTTPADLAPFTEPDLNEARERLLRLADVYAKRLVEIGSQAWDAPTPAGKTIWEIVEHVASTWYAEQVGSLTSEQALNSSTT